MSLTPYLRRHLKQTFKHLDERDLDIAITEFLRFAALAITTERFFFPCDGLIDEIWHTLILETRDYAAFCESLAPGKFLHHTGISRDDYSIGRSLQEDDDEDLSVLASYIFNFGPFSAEGVKHWVSATGLMEKQDWSVDNLNATLQSLSPPRAPSLPDTASSSLLLNFHASHIGVTDMFFSTVKTSVIGKNTYDILVDQIALLEGSAAKVLDVGCGSGSIFSSIAKTLPTTEYVGIDFSPEEIYLARRRIYSPKATFICADAYEIPYKDCYFDVVISHMTMHVLERPDRALTEIRRVLRPGGLLLFVVPTRRNDTESEKSYTDLLALFSTFDSVAKTPIGVKAFRSEEGTKTFLSQVFSSDAPVVTEYLLCLAATESTVLEHLRTMYPYTQMTPNERERYEAMAIQRFRVFQDLHSESTLDRRMSLYSVRRDEYDS